MLDWPMILKCHAHVPVWFWPVLWHYLRRLDVTRALARAEGRKGFMWHVERNGVIWISHVDASEAERRARGELPRDFNRTPWTQLETHFEAVLLARLREGVNCIEGVLLLYRCCTLGALLGPAGTALALLHPP